jgi:hypothetical protein
MYVKNDWFRVSTHLDPCFATFVSARYLSIKFPVLSGEPSAISPKIKSPIGIPVSMMFIIPRALHTVAPQVVVILKKAI